MKPVRIQRRRSKGWRMPPNTVCVTRGTEYGNPFKVGVHGTAEECVQRYIEMVMPYTHHGERNGLDDFLLSVAFIETVQAALSGKNLACWCREGAPCHADFLLKIANDPKPTFER